MNILSFDIEEWYLEKILHGGRDFRYQQFDDAFAKLMDELDNFGIKATFFCVGKLALEYPQVVKTIVEKGHEFLMGKFGVALYRSDSFFHCHFDDIYIDKSET